eukprot:10829549-Alexandrium_andersonii.AAC.1
MAAPRQPGCGPRGRLDLPRDGRVLRRALWRGVKGRVAGGPSLACWKGLTVGFQRRRVCEISA